MAGEKEPDINHRTKLPETPKGGFREAIDRLAILRQSAIEYEKSLAAPKSYATVKKTKEGAIRANGGADWGTHILNMIFQKKDGGWAEEVERRRIEMFEQAQNSPDTEDTEPNRSYSPEYME